MKLLFNNVNLHERIMITKILRCAVKHLGQPSNIEISIAILDKEQIRTLNRDTRGTDKPTDVLSYPYLEMTAGDTIPFDSEINPDTGCIMLGDIAICRSIATEQAQEYGHSYTREVCYLALHSLLHLLGYDHMTEQEESVMTQTAQHIMTKARIIR